MQVSNDPGSNNHQQRTPQDNPLSKFDKIITRGGCCPFVHAAGSMGIGELRSNLYNYAFAKYVARNGGVGEFILRCDDTDPRRVDIKFLDPMYRTLVETVGMEIDYHPYNSKERLGCSLIQTERKELYGEYIDRLLTSGFACRQHSVVHFDVAAFISKKGPTLEVHDAVFGNLSFDLTKLENNGGRRDPNYPLIRSDGSALWHLTTTVDDFLLNVNCVVRAQDKLSNIPYQEMIRIALEFPSKMYAHVPLLMPPVSGDGSALMTITDVVSKGISVGGLISYLLASGYGQADNSYASLEVFVKQFDPRLLHTKNGRLDLTKMQRLDRKMLSISEPLEYLANTEHSLKVLGQQEFSIYLRENQLAQSLVLELRRSPLETVAIVNNLLLPSFQTPGRDTIVAIRTCISAMRALINEGNIILSLEDIISHTDIELKQLHAALRWILTGNETGISTVSALRFVSVGGILSERIQKAEEALLIKVKGQS